MKRTSIISLSVFCILMAGCLKEDPMKQAYTGFDPLDISDGWTLSAPSAEHIDSLALDKVYRDIYADDRFWMTKSLLVFRNGRLVAESYLKDNEDRTKIDAIWSCTKQVNSIIIGIAIDQGYIGSVHDSIGKYLPEYIAKYPDKAGVTLENLLMMGSGVAFDNGTQTDIFRQHKTDNSLDYVLGLDLNFAPGTGYSYNDGDPQVVSGIVQAATGMPLDEYGKEVFLDRIGFSNYEWYRYSDGVTLGAFGILTSPRELAKVAECVLDSGRCQGQQIIPPEWWEAMLTPHVADAGGDKSFGYYWWSRQQKGEYFMWGHGGQFAFIIPSKRMLVVITSLVQVDDDVNISEEVIFDIIDRIIATAE